MLTKEQFLLIFCFLFLSLNATSAQEAIPQMSYGIVKNVDLQLKNWRADSSVFAVVLGDIGTISMQLVDDYYGFHFKEFRRLKILKKEGFRYGNIEIPYYSKDETQRILNIRAQTIAPNGDKFPIDTKTVAYNKVSNDWSVATFTFPELTEGCVVEYEYELHSTRSLELREWYFQDKIPTRFSVLNLDILSRYEYIHLLQGKDNLTVTVPRKDSVPDRVFQTYFAKDLPGLADEQYVTNINNHLTHIHFQLANFIGLNGVKHETVTNWEKLAADLLKNNNFGQKFLKTGNYTQVLEAAKNVVAKGDAAKVKVQKIYDFVNKNIHWNGTYQLMSNNMPNDVWQARNASGADINLTLLALLKDAGIEAFPLLVSTQTHGKVQAEYPVVDQFDHVLILVELAGGQTLTLDAGNTARPMGMPAEQASNGKGWLLKKTEQAWVDIKSTMSSQLLVGKFEIMPNGLMAGTLGTTYRNHRATEHRNSYDAGSTTPEKGRMEYLKIQNPNWQITEVSCLNLEKKQEPLKETITCSITNAVSSDKNWLFITPILKTDWGINPFKLLNRAYPVEFPGLFTEQYVAEIVIPMGYKVEEMPKDLTLMLPSEAVVFNYQIMNDNNNVLKVAMRLQVNKTTFLPEEYTELKSLFRQVAYKMGQKVTLKRVGQ